MVNNKKKLIKDKRFAENEIKKYSNLILKYKKIINNNDEKLTKINEQLMYEDEYIYSEYKEIIKQGIYSSSVTFARYKELYLKKLKSIMKAKNDSIKQRLKSDKDIKKKKSLW